MEDAQSTLTMESLSVQNNLQEAIYHYDFWPWDNILSCYVGENLSSFRWHLPPIVWSKNVQKMVDLGRDKYWWMVWMCQNWITWGNEPFNMKYMSGNGLSFS